MGKVSGEFPSARCRRDAARLSLVAKQLQGCFGIKRGREEVSLGKVAAQGAKLIKLRGPLDTLRDYGAVQFAGESEDKVNNIVSGAIGLHVGHESAIDFQDVGSELTQRRQGEIATSEIIDGSDDIQTLELREDFHGLLGIGHGDAFGDRELKRGGLDAGIAQAGLDPVE